jgi:DNA polymerase-3 subunit gamma/tau
MSYLVLARKYRPQRFSELVGQEHVARTLGNAIAQNRVHHAFLFTGARGVGKTSAARILAKSLCCVHGPTVDPCGVCDACQEIAGGRSVDIVEIDGASNTGVDDVRTLREGARYLPAKARLKIYIIDEVHMLSTSAFNALLKTLEEPPPHVVFIFATTEVHKIPSTILSRCQRYDFKLIPTLRLGSHLEGILGTEKIDFEPSAVRLLARQAAGSVRDALSLLDQVIAYVGPHRLEAAAISEVLGIADRALLVDLARALQGRDVAAALRLLSAAVERGVDLGQLARAFLGLVRDLELASRIADPAALEQLVDASPDELRELVELGAGGDRPEAPRREPPAGVGSDLFAVWFDRWARAVDESARSTSPRLLLEMALVDLCQAEPLVPLGDLLERLEGLENRLRARGAAGPSGSAGGSGPGAGVSQPLGPVRGPGAPGRESRVEGAPDRGVEAAAHAAVAAPVVPARRAPPAAGVEPVALVDLPGAGAVAAAAPAAAARVEPEATPTERWRRVRQELERRRPRVGALLANAHLLEVDVASLVLGFDDRVDAEAAERVRSDIEQALSAEWGRPVRFQTRHESIGPKGSAVALAENTQDAEQRASERRLREEEARRHPMIQKVQDLFGVGIREIKT